VFSRGPGIGGENLSTLSFGQGKVALERGNTSRKFSLGRNKETCPADEQKKKTLSFPREKKREMGSCPQGREYGTEKKEGNRSVDVEKKSGQGSGTEDKGPRGRKKSDH